MGERLNITIVSVFIVLVFSFLLFILPSIIIDAQVSEMNNFAEKLELLGVTVEEGIVESPSLILELEYDEFSEKALEVRLVYRHNRGIYSALYIFSEDYQVAWKWS